MDKPHLPSEADAAFIHVGSHYSRAPVVEAIIEIRCELPDGVELDTLKGAVCADDFPKIAKHYELSGTFNFSDAGILSDTTAEAIGFVFKSKDDLQVVQARLNGFSYAVLAPYDKWETFCKEAWHRWKAYQDLMHPAKATRLGVRYINRIDIPNGQIEIKDYLRTAVDVSPYLPQMVASYFLQVQVPLARYGAVATVTSTLTPPPRENTTSLILDIDVWRSMEIDLVSDGASPVIQNALESLRQAKNYTFEACITDATRGLIL